MQQHVVLWEEAVLDWEHEVSLHQWWLGQLILEGLHMRHRFSHIRGDKIDACATAKTTHKIQESRPGTGCRVNYRQH